MISGFSNIGLWTQRLYARYSSKVIRLIMNGPGDPKFQFVKQSSLLMYVSELKWMSWTDLKTC